MKHSPRPSAPALARVFSRVLAFALVAATFATASSAAATPPAKALDPAHLAALEARSIGPAGMSGRVAAVAALPTEPHVIYVGAASGGVWRSENDGVTWEPIFDREDVQSIGAVAIHPKQPDHLWVGTGEGNPRNSVSIGGGVYRSIDRGRTWTRVGLEKSERIHRIVLHPEHENVAWVAALGPLWSDGEERGVFKTEDGGKTWRRVLSVDARTGCADLAVDPSNPHRMLAAMWEHRRAPWTFQSGGPGSGLYLTVDGGETWKRLGAKDGLPEGDLGRMGLAFAPSRPEIVYAFVEAKRNVLLRSEDGGLTWRDTGAERRFGNRPFYYADLRVDPENHDRVYSLWTLVSVSDDGGKNWRVLVPFRDIHPDHHAMWINPRDGRHIVIGNDGGVAISRDRGLTWRFVENLPLAQYYHLRVDDEQPFNVYGGLQDNGSWRGPSSVWENGGIRNHHWEEVGFGDGFDTAADPSDPRRGYAMSQEGFLSTWDLETGESRMIRPASPDGTPLRFNWNAGFAQDPFDPATIYFGSQFVHRSRDRGLTWEVVSPDLTTNDPDRQQQAKSGGLTPDVTGAENNTTIVALAPSPIAKNMLWAGTDDGRLHLTTDGGASWESQESRLKGVPQGAYVIHVEPSRHDAKRAFVVLDDHRRGDHRAYALRTDDGGRTWKKLATGDVPGWALVIEEDPVDPELLFLGTEFGLFVSQDGGASFFAFRHGIPATPVADVVVHPREHDLVVATHGRGIFVVDDIRPLRALDEEVRAKPLFVFEAPPAQQHEIKQTGASRFPGHGEFRGANRPYGALISFWIDDEKLEGPFPDSRERARRAALAKPDAKPGDDPWPKAAIEIEDANGTRIRGFETPIGRGLNRAVWDLRRDAFERPRENEEWDDGAGPEVPWGVYRVVVRHGEQRAETLLTVTADPRLRITDDARRASWEANLRVGALAEAVAGAVRRIEDVRADAERLRSRASARLAPRNPVDEKPQALVDIEKQVRTLLDLLDGVERKVWAPPREQGYVADDHAWAKVSRARWMIESSWDAPTPAALTYLAEAEAAVADALEAVDALFATEIPDLRAAEAAQALAPFAGADSPLPRPAR